MDIDEQEFQELKDKLAASEKEVERLSKMHEADQDFLKKREAEVGDLRKEVAELAEKISEQPARGSEGKSPKASEVDDESNQTLEELEASLTDAQRAKVEEVWNSFPEKRRAELYEDDDALKELYSTVKDVEKAVPESPWKKREPKQKQKRSSFRDEVLAAINEANKGTRSPREPEKRLETAPSLETQKHVSRGAGVLQTLRMAKER